MKSNRMAFVETQTGINYAGEVLRDSFVEDGLLIKPSQKSEVKIWLPLDQVKRVILADRSEISAKDGSLAQLFQRMTQLPAIETRGER